MASKQDRDDYTAALKKMSSETKASTDALKSLAGIVGGPLVAGLSSSLGDLSKTVEHGGAQMSLAFAKFLGAGEAAKAAREAFGEASAENRASDRLAAYSSRLARSGITPSDDLLKTLGNAALQQERAAGTAERRARDIIAQQGLAGQAGVVGDRSFVQTQKGAIQEASTDVAHWFRQMLKNFGLEARR